MYAAQYDVKYNIYNVCNVHSTQRNMMSNILFTT